MNSKFYAMLLGLAFSSAPLFTSGATINPDDAKEIVKGATDTFVAFKKDPARAPEISKQYWAPAIRKLTPIKVYLHMNNVVVVQRVAGGREEGLYIYQPLSSYLPIDGVQGFALTPKPNTGDIYTLGTGIFSYQKTMTNQAVQQTVAWPTALLLDIDSIPVITNVTGVGVEYRNLYGTASKDQACAKLERFRKLGRTVSVAEFVGSSINRIRIIWTSADSQQSCELMRDLLRSTIIDPKGPEGPMLHLAWSEITAIRVRALVDYDGGRVGSLETDGREHLLIEDCDGTFWWARLDIQASSKANRPSSGSQPTVSPTKGSSASARSGR